MALTPKVEEIAEARNLNVQLINDRKFRYQAKAKFMVVLVPLQQARQQRRPCRIRRSRWKSKRVSRKVVDIYLRNDLCIISKRTGSSWETTKTVPAINQTICSKFTPQNRWHRFDAHVHGDRSRRAGRACRRRDARGRRNSAKQYFPD